MDLPAFPHGGPASCGSFFCARPPYGDRQSHLTKSDLFLPSAPCRHEVMSLPTLSIETQLCLFFLPFLFSRIIFPLFCYLSDPIVSLSDPAQTPNSILICITYPLLNSPSSMFTGLQPTAYHLGCHFFPPTCFLFLAFSLFDRFISLFNRRLASVPFYLFLSFNILQFFFLSYLAGLHNALSTCLGLDLLPLLFNLLSFSFFFFKPIFCAKIVHFPSLICALIHAS